MKGKIFFLYIMIIALWEGIITLITWQMNGFIVETNTPLTYITFVAWASYFLVGANVRDAAVALGSCIAGEVCAALIFALSILFGFVPWWAVPLGVFIIVPFMLSCEKVKPISNVAMVFMGAAVYFSLSAAGAFNEVGFTAKGYVLVGITQIIYIIIGFFAPWVQVQVHGFCSRLEEGDR